MKVETEKIKDKKVIAFQIKNEEYALMVDQVYSIERMMPITRVPHTPQFVKGVINLRGVVIPLIDLRVRLGVEETAYQKQTRIIIVQTEDEEVGLIVDAANDVISISDDDIKDLKDTFTTVNEKYIQGVLKIDKRLIVLLNLDKVLIDPEADEDAEQETVSMEDEQMNDRDA